jgi:hypothetical protein
LKKPKPLLDHAFNGRTEVKLSPKGIQPRACDERAVLLIWKAWARSWTSIVVSTTGYRFTVVRPTETGTNVFGVKDVPTTA